MTPDDMTQAWKTVLDDLRDRRDDLRKKAVVSPPVVSRLQMGEGVHDKYYRARQAYEDALSACIIGEDPVMWKLSYNGPV